MVDTYCGSHTSLTNYMDIPLEHQTKSIFLKYNTLSPRTDVFYKIKARLGSRNWHYDTRKSHIQHTECTECDS